MSTVAAPDAVERLKERFLTRDHHHLIDGEWVPSATGETFPTLNPADGQVLAHVALGGAGDIDRAVRAAA